MSDQEYRDRQAAARRARYAADPERYRAEAIAYRATHPPRPRKTERRENRPGPAAEALTSSLDQPRVREELAWAAGFYDGEGCVISRGDPRHRGVGVLLSVAQVEPQPLERFVRATGGLLKIRSVDR